MQRILELTAALAWLGFSLQISRPKYVSGSNPLVPFLSAWALSFAVHYSGFIYYDELSLRGLSTLYTGILATAIGCRAGVSSQPIHKPSRLPTFDVHLGALTAFTLSFVFGAVSWIAAIGAVFGAGALLSDPGTIRSGLSGEDLLQRLGIVARTCFLFGPLAIYFWLRAPFAGKLQRRYSRALGLCLFPLLFLGLGRTLPLTVLLWLTMTWWLFGDHNKYRSGVHDLAHHRSRQRRIYLIAGSGIFCLAIFVGLASLLGKDGQNDVRTTAHVHPSLHTSPLLSPLIYQSGGIGAFGKLVDDPSATSDGYLPGVRTFRPVLEFIPGTELPPPVSEFREIPIPFNVYTYLEPYYRDFGYVGVVLGAFGFGFLIGRLHTLAQSSARFIPSASLAATIGLFAPFTSRLSTPFIAASLVLAFLIARRKPAAIVLHGSRSG